MAIKNVKVTPRSIGITTASAPRKKATIWTAKVSYSGPNRANIYVLLNQITKQNYQGLVVGQDFFIVCSTIGYFVYTQEGELSSTLPLSIGKMLQVDKDSFITRIENSIFEYNSDGTLSCSRELTDYEVELLDKKSQ